MLNACHWRATNRKPELELSESDDDVLPVRNASSNMTLYTRVLSSVLWLVSVGGCTTLESSMSIEPYTKDKAMRDALEQAAEAYCAATRATRAGGSRLRPDYLFTTDGCSRWPDGAWTVCCIAHDIAYWCGGSALEREDADRELRRCVNGHASVIGDIVYVGVRIGGLPWLPTPWRWGYGWDRWPQSYQESPASREQLYDRLRIYELIDTHLSSDPARNSTDP
jgi:hypothetical protein